MIGLIVNAIRGSPLDMFRVGLTSGTILLRIVLLKRGRSHFIKY